MPITQIHSYLIHAGKGVEEERQINGVSIPLAGKIYEMLHPIYANSDEQCDLEIGFNRGADGQQENECRNLLVDYLYNPNIETGKPLANKLENVTTGRSGLGLLFLVVGFEGVRAKIVISRFPAEAAILAEENQQELTVEFIDKVFLKSARAFKAAAYEHESIDAGFWRGRATDRQRNSGQAELSKYWINEFLDSDFITTAANGTRRLAVALRDAAKKSADVSVKTEIVAAATLANRFAGQAINAEEFARRSGLTAEATRAIEHELKQPAVVRDMFEFDVDEFQKLVQYRTVELHTGGMLTAVASEFDDIFEHEVIDEREHTVRYVAEGAVVNEKIGKAR